MNRSSQLPGLIQQMMDPAFYDHPVREPIQLQQTHISYVLLTGQYAYKVKKPVTLPFLDFSSPEQRLLNLELELTRNQRFCPQLYQAVLPIVKGNGSYRFGQDGDVVDYALRMQEFPQEALWRRRFEEGRITLGMATDLGKAVAQLHAAAERGPLISSYGDVAVVAEVAEDNYRDTLRFLGRLQDPAHMEQTRTFTRHFFCNHSDLLRERQREGFVRACHGDLHLNNITTWQGSIQAFDCIEFNPTFYNIDTLYDAAFILVDFEQRHRTDLAWQFINTYLETTGDYRGAALLPLYACMRAYVRAKVYSIQSEEPTLSERARVEAEDKARTFYKLAHWFTWPRPEGVWLVTGLSGSGKSTVAGWLAQRMGAVHLRSDALRKHLAHRSPNEPGDEKLYTPERNRQTYEQLNRLGAFLAGHGLPVILDARYSRREDREALYQQVSQRQLPVHVIHCEAPEALLRYRLAHRRGDVSDATPEVLDKQLGRHESFGPDEPVIRVDTARDWRRQLAENMETGPLLCA